MAFYECVVLARQEVSGQQVETMADEISNTIIAGGGQVLKKEFWGLRNLTYRMKKNRKAHYVLLNLDSPSPAVKEAERLMSLNEDVLRYLTVRVDELEEGPSAMMQAKSGRDEREGRGDRGDRMDRPRRDFGGFRGDREGGERPPRRAEGGE